MAPFSVAQLKEKASNVKSSGSDKFQSVKGKYTNRSSADPNRVPGAANRAIAPPLTQTVREGSHIPGQPARPPPTPRGTRPDAPPTSRVHDRGDHSKDGFKWSSISPADKALFFSLLDEFFDTKAPRPGKFNQPQGRAADDINGGPRAAEMSSFPHSEQGSAAQDLTNFFSPNTQWDTPWYSSEQPTPSPLVTTTDGMRMHSIQWSGDNRTLSGGVLFSDLSACWYTVSWTDRNAHDTSRARRATTFAPRPGVLSREELVHAHETYGETVAGFAESYEGTGRWCARGECWDLANEALKTFDQWDYVPKPLPCIGTTHGHLIYEGNAWGNNAKTEQAGRWRGEDDRIRRGDIIQWKTVKIVDGNRWFTLGDPDHTAIIVCDQQPLKTPLNDGALRPADLGSVEVVEQSAHSPPARQVYKLGGMVSGEVRVYRPVGMEAYLKFSFSATSPEGL